jgi:flagellar protein FlbD
MITVTRINNQPITINAELIEFIESTPDTIVTTTHGKKIIVKDSIDSIIEKVIQYRRKCFLRSNWEEDRKT